MKHFHKTTPSSAKAMHHLFVNRYRSALCAIAVILFIGFLVSPGFTDSVQGDGTITMLPGYAAVIWLSMLVPYSFTHSLVEAFVCVSLLLAHVAFVLLPVLVISGRFRPLIVRSIFGILFASGLFSMAWMFCDSQHVTYGIFLWLLAAISALILCILPHSRES